MNIIKCKFFIKLIMINLFLIVLSTGCNNSGESSTTRNRTDSTRSISNKDSVGIIKNINLDSISIINSNNTKSVLERVNIDSISSLSAQTSSLDYTANKLTRQLKLNNRPTLTIGSRDYYILEGDIKLDRFELYNYYQERLQNVDTNITGRIKSGKLTMATDASGNLAKWEDGKILYYSVMRNSFGSKSSYEKVVRNMKLATENWMNTCNVKFAYEPEYDTKDIDLEIDTSTNLLFTVRQINAHGSFIAQAFFPGDPSFERILVIDPSYFSTSFDSTGVFRHELGHVLGFRHEHIWSTENSCKLENIIEGHWGAKPLTNYDPYSVMHYVCGKSGSSKLEITDFDKKGSIRVYGAPLPVH